MKKNFNKKLELNKTTLAGLNQADLVEVNGGGWTVTNCPQCPTQGCEDYTRRPGGDCGRSDNFTYVAACPATFVCGTGGECGGGGNPHYSNPGHPMCA